MKDKSIHPPMKVPIPRAGNPALTERAYIPEDVTLISRPAPTPTLPISEHGGELFIVSSAFSAHASSPTPAPTVSLPSSVSLESSLLSDDSLPPPSGGNVSDAPPRWAESLIGITRHCRGP